MNKRQVKKRDRRELFKTCFDKKPSSKEKKHALEVRNMVKKPWKMIVYMHY